MGSGGEVGDSYMQQTSKALLIGIDYEETKFPLHVAQYDIPLMLEFLTEDLGYPAQGIRILYENCPELECNNIADPTKVNMLNELKMLINNATAGDRLFLYFTGHGDHVFNWNGDDDGWYDNTLVPLDCDEAGVGCIIDDQLYDIISTLPAKVRLTVVFDCCNSGTALDLPFICGQVTKIKSINQKPYKRGDDAHVWYRNRYGVSRTREIAHKAAAMVLPEKHLPRSPGGKRARHSRARHREHKRRVSERKEDPRKGKVYGYKSEIPDIIKGQIRFFAGCADGGRLATKWGQPSLFTTSFLEQARLLFKGKRSKGTYHKFLWALESARCRSEHKPMLSSSHIFDVHEPIEF